MTDNIIRATISEITALTAATTQSTIYYSTDADKEGLWKRSDAPEPTTTPNGGTIIKNSDNYVWRRIIENNLYYPEWFGAVGNGNITDDTKFHTINNDTTALVNTIKAAAKAASGSTVFLTRGKVYAVANVVIYSPIKISGRGILKYYIKYDAPQAGSPAGTPSQLVKTQFSDTSLTYPILNLDEQAKDVIIEDITIDGFRTSLESIKALAASDSTVKFPAETAFRGVFAKSMNVDGVDKIVTNIKLNNVTIRNTFDEAIQFENVDGAEITSCKIFNCNQPGYMKVIQTIPDKKYDAAVLASTVISYTNSVKEQTINNVVYKNTVKKGFKNVIVQDCLFDQTSYKKPDDTVVTNRNGCLKFPVQDSRTLEYVRIVNNTMLTTDFNEPLTVKINGEIVTVPQSDDNLGIIGIELYNKTDGAIYQLLISGNTIECQQMPNPDTSDSAWKGLKYHAFGISLGGSSITDGRGIVNAVISNNIIRYCRRYGIELMGSNITVIGNELYDCGYIGVNSKSTAGGQRNVKIIGNSIKANTGYQQAIADGSTSHGYGVYYAGLMVQVLNNDMMDILIENNIFDIYHMIANDVDISNYRSDQVYIKCDVEDDLTPIPTLYNLNVSGNIFKSVLRHGINFDPSSKAQNVKISNNSFIADAKKAYSGPANEFVCSHIRLTGVYLKNLLVEGNSFNCKSVGSNVNLDLSVIAVHAPSANVSYTNVCISNNMIDGASKGISLTGTKDILTIVNNTFTDTPVANTIVVTGTSTRYNNSLYNNVS